MAKLESKITYKTLDLDCKIEYEIDPYCPGDRMTPPMDGSVQIQKIEFHGMDITDYITTDVISDLEHEIWEEQ